MNCPDCENLFGPYLEGFLDPLDSARLEAHAADCPACRASLEETRRLRDRLAADSAPPSSGGAVMDRIFRRQALQLRRRLHMKRITQLASAAALLVGLGVFLTLPGPHAGRAFADELTEARKQMEGAKTATWSASYYERLRNKERTKSLWFRDANNNQRYSYKAPGLYRCEHRGDDGKPTFVSIEDQTKRARLDVNYREKTATLTPLNAIESNYHPRGPFAGYLELMKGEDLRSLGKRTIAGREANGFRFARFEPVLNRDHSQDFWVDAATRRLVLCQVPGGDLFDRAEIVADKAVAFPVDSVEYDGSTFARNRENGGQGGGHILDEIAFDVPLDDSLFRLEPPDGFTLKSVQPPTITEADVIAFLRLTADYFDGSFPDAFPRFRAGVEGERFDKLELDVLAGREVKPAQRALIESWRKWMLTGIPGPGPVHAFLQHQVVEGSWKYLGKGVKLGDKSAIVCWYRPKDAKSYRVVRGDLGVSDVSPADLPLPVDR